MTASLDDFLGMKHDDDPMWVIGYTFEHFLAPGFWHVLFNDGTRQRGDVVLNNLRSPIGHDRRKGSRVLDKE